MLISTYRRYATSLPPKMHNGVWYFPDFWAAHDYALTKGYPTDRIIEYVRGFAIQLRKSGPYVGPGEAS